VFDVALEAAPLTAAMLLDSEKSGRIGLVVAPMLVKGVWWTFEGIVLLRKG